MKRFSAILFIVLFTLSFLSGCSKSESELSAINENKTEWEYSKNNRIYRESMGEDIDFVSIVFRADSENTDEITNGAKRAGEEIGENVNVYFAETADEQAEILEDLLTEKNPKAVCIAAYPSQKVNSYIYKVIAAGIKCIDPDGSLKEFENAVEIKKDYGVIGSLIYEQIKDEIGESGKIGVVTGTSEEEIAESFKTITESDGNVYFYIKKSEDINEQCIDFLEENRRVRAVFVTSEYVLKAMVNAAELLGVSGDIKIIGFGNSEEVLELLRKKKIYAAVQEDYEKFGYNVVMSASKENADVMLGYLWVKR